MKYKVGDWVVWHIKRLSEDQLSQAIHILAIEDKNYKYEYQKEWYGSGSHMAFTQSISRIDRITRPLSKKEKLELL